MKKRLKLIYLLLAALVILVYAGCANDKTTNAIEKMNIEQINAEYILDCNIDEKGNELYILSRKSLSKTVDGININSVELEINEGKIAIYKNGVYVLDKANNQLFVFNSNLELIEENALEFECNSFVDMLILKGSILFFESDKVTSSLLITDLKGKVSSKIDLPKGIISMTKDNKDKILFPAITHEGNLLYYFDVNSENIYESIHLPQTYFEHATYDVVSRSLLLVSNNYIYSMTDFDQSDIKPIANLGSVVETGEVYSSTIYKNLLIIILDGQMKMLEYNLENEQRIIKIFGNEGKYDMEVKEIFAETYEDYLFSNVSLESSADYNKLLVDLALQSGEYDIFYILDLPSNHSYVNNINSYVMKENNYMMDLSSSEILVDYVNGMHDWIKDICYDGEELVMIPIHGASYPIVSNANNIQDLSWEDLAGFDLDNLEQEYLISAPSQFVLISEMLGQYMLSFRSDDNYVDFTLDEFDTLIEIVGRLDEEGYFYEYRSEPTAGYDNDDDKVMLHFISSFNLLRDVGEFSDLSLYELPEYENYINLKSPINSKFLAININSTNKEAALIYLEQVAYQAYEEDNSNMVFGDIDKYIITEDNLSPSLGESVELKDTDEMIQKKSEILEIIKNGNAYPDSNFIAYAIFDLLPVYIEGTMNQEEFKEFFIEKYEMWYKEQQ